MDKKVVIVPGLPEDVQKIMELARRTFLETYVDQNDVEDIRLYMEKHFTEAVLAGEMAATDSRFFIAYVDGIAVGFTKLRWSITPKNMDNRKPLELQRIYVMQEYQGFSIGKSLMDQVKSYAREHGYNSIWLQVWQKNTKALKFYQHAGFVVYETTTFQMGREEHQDFLMRNDLYY
jgi:ribosomal protein S18 acetylase RimI-like enzyme